MRKFWAEEEKSEALEPILDQEKLDRVSEETEAVISGKEPLLSGEEEQLLLPGGTGSVVSNRDLQVQVETEYLTSNRDVDVQIETEHLTSNIDVEVQVKTEQLISNRDVEVQVKIEQIISNRDVEVQVKIEQIISNRDVEVQLETGPVSNTDVTVQTDGDTEIEDLRRKNENMAKELANKQAVIESHENQLADYYQSILELKAELKMAQEKNDVHNQKRSQGHQSLVEELQGEISKALVQNHELKEAMSIITKNEGLREQPENKVKRE
ncbi:probable inactive protein kinase DDB_G0270444 [Palaemon carinicauda]|uniref:probable inactive protein kinase DDB_G0270444 n=1 Tax=Palaemon carinicauda TaxID=392227 RepID=UPI0035B59CB6